MHWGNSTEDLSIFLTDKRAVHIITKLGVLESCRALFGEMRILTITSITLHL